MSRRGIRVASACPGASANKQRRGDVAGFANGGNDVAEMPPLSHADLYDQVPSGRGERACTSAMKGGCRWLRHAQLAKERVQLSVSSVAAVAKQETLSLASVTAAGVMVSANIPAPIVAARVKLVES